MVDCPLLMPDEIFKSALEAAQREYDELQEKRAEIDARIARLRETIVSLAYLINHEGQAENIDLSGIGLKDAVVKVLRLSGMALSPANIRDELIRMGFDTKRYAEIIPTITKVLQRLHEKGNVDVSLSGTNERKFYIWSPIQPANASWTEKDDEDLKKQVRAVFGGNEGELLILEDPPYVRKEIKHDKRSSSKQRPQKKGGKIQ